ncbi:MAG: ABC transporter ATP-binding protein [Planctomycetota bacterium]|jgi:subfamily B ATP-binding cassette protein MsbA
MADAKKPFYKVHPGEVEKPPKMKSFFSLARILREVRPHIRVLILIQFIGFLILGISAAIPLGIHVVTQSLEEGDLSVLVWIPPLGFLLTFLIATTRIIQGLLSTVVSRKIAFDLQKRIYNHFLTMSMREHFRVPLGEKMSRITFDIQWLVQGAMMFFTNMLYIPVMILVYGGIVFYFNWQIGLIAALALPVNLLASLWIGKPLRGTSKDLQDHNVKVSHHILDTLRGMLIVKIFRREAKEREGLAALLRDYVRLHVRNMAWGSTLKGAIRVVNFLFLWLVGWYAFHLLSVTKTLEVSDLVAVAAVLFLFYGEITKFSPAVETMNRASVSCDRIYGMLEGEKRDGQEALRPVEGFRDEFVVEGAAFAYNEDTPVLKDVNMAIGRGDRVAFAGYSGSGKTTLVRLLLGLIQPQEGRVLLDGVDTGELEPDGILSLFAYAPQTTTLFNLSIRDNIAYGRPEASEEEVVQASVQACAHEFIETFPKGYDTQIGDMGAEMSEGQRQRICIARTLLVDAPILVFDESFSQIDVPTEKKIYRNIMDLKEKTIIIISHRLTAIQETDRIYHVSDGKIIEVGSHEELINMEGEYRNLFKQ